MSFQTYEDFWALVAASGTPAQLVLKSSEKTKAIPVNATAKNAAGNVTARGLAGADYSVSNAFAFANDVTALEDYIILGKVAGSTDKLLLTEFTLKLATEAEPELTVSGVSVQSGASTSSYRSVTLPACAFSAAAIAQDPFAGAFTLTGTGCDLNEVSISGKIAPTLSKPNGSVVRYTFGGAVIEMQIKVVQSGATAPTIEAAGDWKLTAGPSKSSPENDYDVWTATLTLDIDGDDPA